MISRNRDSNFELYRCIAMFLIVACHWGLLTGLFDIVQNNQLTTPSNFYYILKMWGKMGINCFLLITGYFMCTSEITIRKFVKLYFQIIFYSLSIHFLFYIIADKEYSLLDWILLFFPCREIESDNFVHAFLVWWLFIPFLNILVKGMDYKVHKRLIILSIIIFTILPMLPQSIYRISINPICWYSIIYFIASFIRKYPNQIFYNSSAKMWGIITLVCIFFSVLSVFGFIYLSQFLDRFISPYKFMNDSNAPLALLTAVSSFMFFKNLNIKYNKFINIIGSTTFGILLIHSNCYSIRIWIWNDVFDCLNHYDTPHYWFYALSGIFIVFSICSFIDYIRIITIEKYIMNILDKKFIKKIKV